MATDGTTLNTNSGTYTNAAMWVVFGTSFGIDYSQDVLLTGYFPNSATALPYQKFTATVTAKYPTEILSFHGVDATSAILLDNVTMTPAPPELSLSLSPTNTLVFTWTYATNGFFLQANPTLGTTNWVTLTNRPTTVGAGNQVILPAPASDVFYRLAPP